MRAPSQDTALHQRHGVVLFADVVGYARLMGQNEIDTYSTLKSLLEQLETACRAQGGSIVSVRGDGVLALFDTASDAVTFGVALHRIAKACSPSLPPRRQLLFRAGVHMGRILEDERGIHGENVNIAARLQEIAEPGRLFISAPVYEAIRNRLRFGYEYLGPQRLKNITEPVAVYCVRSEASGATLAASRRPLLPPRTAACADLPSIAVLPFSCEDGTPADGWLADGLTEDIILNLSRFRNLFVIARNSAFQFKTAPVPPQQAAEALGVRYAAGGSLRRDGGRMRISIELTDARSGRSIWAEHYDRETGGIFSLQDEVTEAIAAAAAVSIEAEELRRIDRVPPKQLTAYGYLLRGQQYLFRYTRQDNRQARRLYQRALARDPGYARASAAVSRTLNIAWRYGWDRDRAHALDAALAHAQTAAELDPADARGFGELGFAHLYRKEHDAALGAYARALELNPNDADLLSDYGDALAHCGDNETAIRHLQRAMRLNPFYPDQYLWHLAGAYYNLRQYETVIATLTRMNNPTEGLRMLAASHAQLGQLDQARQLAALHRQAHPGFRLEEWTRVQPDRLEEDTRHFAEGLRKAGF